MKKIFKHLLIIAIVALSIAPSAAQQYPEFVTLESNNDKIAVFTTYGVADKKRDAETNAVQSLFYTLFHRGVVGINNGRPLLEANNQSYVNNFLQNRYGLYSTNRVVISGPERNANKKFEINVRVSVPIEKLFEELSRNNLNYSYAESQLKQLPSNAEMQNVVLPTIMVVPYKKSGECYDYILQNDYDRRVAVSKLQSAFEDRGITTIDISAKIAAMKRRSEYENGLADSNDKQLLLSSGAEVYVVVDLLKDIDYNGSRVSLVMKAYETSSGSILASQDGFTRTYNTNDIDVLCSYAVDDNADEFLDEIINNLAEQVTEQKRVVLQISISENSMTSMDDITNDGRSRLSDMIRNWVRENADNGQYHIQGVVSESMIFDYVMIPPVAKDGYAMDATQFEYEFRNFLQDKGYSCSSKVDGNTIYISID